MYGDEQNPAHLEKLTRDLKSIPDYEIMPSEELKGLAESIDTFCAIAFELFTNRKDEWF